MGHASARPSRALGAAASFFTQQYEGRAELDVSILPWNGELGLMSASLHLMDSPSVCSIDSLFDEACACWWFLEQHSLAVQTNAAGPF